MTRPAHRASNRTRAAATPDGSSGSSPFPIVGIGASAGGLAAFEAFFRGMPSDADPGMAFILVQHLAPEHESLLAELVARSTRMRVREAEDGAVVEPNCAYVIPPNRDLAIAAGRLRLYEPASPRGPHLPIDFFFRSLADDQGERAICVVLSGTGSDGTLGVRAVKARGGMVMAQTPASSAFDGMPQAAIATGLVDYVLEPAEMPGRLLAYAAHTARTGATPLLALSPGLEATLTKLLLLVRAQTGHDFTQYKVNTLFRRAERRMAVHQLETLDEYLTFLRQRPEEVEALVRDFLIGVTRFFRDPEAFAALEHDVLPRLAARCEPGSQLRVWVPACATGEEAYSIAMLLKEHQETTKQDFVVQMFATDLDSRAIDFARTGLYPQSIAAEVGAARLARHFTGVAGGGFRVHKRIRDLLLFSVQDVCRDPPFSRLDLVSCRNLLIYMQPELQRRVLSLFHYALTPGGALLLGNSETVGDGSELFSVSDRAARIYERRESAPPGARLNAITSPVVRTRDQRPTAPAQGPLAQTPPLKDLAVQTLLQHSGAVAALVAPGGEILYLHGRTGQYLEPAPGEGQMNVLKMARPGLERELPVALHRAAAGEAVVRRTGLTVEGNGQPLAVDVTVRVVEGRPDQQLFLVIFEPSNESPAPRAINEGDAGDQRVQALLAELHAQERYLQSTQAAMQTTNEELRSSNEELQATNEELQSANEELETSREELQSVNEELATVNAELGAKLADLSQVNNDMNNLLAATGIGTVYVDHLLRIQRFTPAVTQLLNVIPTDVGRPLPHIVTNFRGYDALERDVRATLDTLIPREVEVETTAGVWFLLRIRPYRTQENAIEGAVVTFVEISEVKRVRQALETAEALNRLAIVVRDANDAIVVHDLAGSIVAWNPGAHRLYGWTEEEALGLRNSARIPPDLRTAELALERGLIDAEQVPPRSAQRLNKAGALIDVWVTTSALIGSNAEVYAIATTETRRSAHPSTPARDP